MPSWPAAIRYWNGHGAGGCYNPAYFLDFSLPEGCRRISYIPPVSVKPTSPEKTCARAGAALRRFTALSVRNELSRDLVRRFSGRDASVTLDPTLLHDYEELVPDPAVAGNYSAFTAWEENFGKRASVWLPTPASGSVGRSSRSIRMVDFPARIGGNCRPARSNGCAG